MSKSLFKAFRTGVLEIDERFEVDYYFRYKLVPTPKSVRRLRELLFKEPTVAPCPASEPAVSNSSGASMIKTQRPAAVPTNTFLSSKASHYMYDSLVMYAVYKISLYGTLNRYECEALKKAVFRQESKQGISTGFGNLIDDLYGVKKPGDLFAALMSNSDMCEVKTTWTRLYCESPRIIAHLVKEYAESRKNAKHIRIPENMSLNTECRYYLVAARMYTNYCCKKIDWHKFYFMSRFSSLPSEEVRKMCIEKRPECLVYEKEGYTPAKLVAFNVGALPKEVQFHILIHVDLLSQVYMVPRVCVLWERLHRDVLNNSRMVQEALESDLCDPQNLVQILNLRRCPWNRFFESRLDVLRCLLLQCSLELAILRDVGEKIEHVWDQIETELGNTKLGISSASYLDLYVRCCQVLEVSLVFYQLPGMSDGEYVTLLRSIIEQHGIIPTVPKRFLEEDCGRFVQMLENSGDLAAQLLQDGTQQYEKLAAHLFSTKSSISSAIASVLGENSTRYYYLFRGGSETEGYMAFIFRERVKDHDMSTLAHDVINLCLLLGPEGSPETIKSLRERVRQFYQEAIGPNRGPQLAQKERQRLGTFLGEAVMKFLQKNRRCFSGGEIDAIERVLDQSGLWDEDCKKTVFHTCISPFLSDLGFTIKLIC